MAGEKPTAAMVLSVIGGLLILVGGIAYIALSSLFESALGVIPPGTFPFDPAQVFLILGAIGVVIGLIIMVGGIMMYSRPMSSTIWGVIILILSLVSLMAGGGFFLGLILALVGGILGIVWKPPVAAPMPPTPPMPPQGQ